MAPGILASCRARQQPPGAYLGSFHPRGNSFYPAGQFIQRFGQIHATTLGVFFLSTTEL